MRVNVDLFDPQSNMDSDFSSGLPDSDFGFAFNDSNFSDRVLRIEIIPDLPDSKSDGDACSSIADWARNRKRRREEIKKDTGRFLFFDFLEIKCFIFFSNPLVLLIKK